MTSIFLRVVNPSEPCEAMPPKLAMDIPFALDPFQQHAIAAISRDENVLVTAKTGSGKTLVGEYQIAHSLAKGRRVFYTTPIKSLSNQKFYDLKRAFPSVGIMTGDLKFRPDADVVIMTTEILRNLLFKATSTTRQLGITADLSLDRLDAVVFDECHYINDRDRGAVWEETMILLPREVNLVLLSATIDGPQFFASWLGELKQKPIHLISTTYRIVPLQHAVYRGDELLTIMDNKETFEGGLYTGWLRWRAGAVKAADDHRARVADRRRGGYEDGPVARGAAGPKAYRHQLNELIARLEGATLLPALVFVFSRRDCERYAAAIEHTLLDSSDASVVRHMMDFHLHRYGEELQRLQQYQTLRGLLEKGIAFHHSGLLPVLKEMVEVLFGRGLVKLLFATETFAVGINMPTKTVIFTGYRKYDDSTGGMRLLNTDEYIQMAGRAGRRGKDDRGLVLYLPDREPEAMEDVKRMMTGARATFQSRMSFGYDFLLKTLQAGCLDWIRLLRDSYWFKRHQMLQRQVEGELAAARDAAAKRAVTPEQRAEMLEHDRLKEAVRTSVNAARRKAQQEWSAWENKHIGPRWAEIIKTTWPFTQVIEHQIVKLEQELAAMDDPTADVWPRLASLGRMGLLQEPVGPDHPLTLTALGVAATEVNEGHTILMPMAFAEHLFHELSPAETVTALAIFLGESKGDAAATPIEALRVDAPVSAALSRLSRIADRLRAAEPVATDAYWTLSTEWVEVLDRWMAGAPVTEVCSDFGLYEGNLMRMLLKMVNIVEEWRCLATLAKDVEMLEKLRGVEVSLLRDMAVCDSLYLRL